MDFNKPHLGSIMNVKQYPFATKILLNPSWLNNFGWWSQCIMLVDVCRSMVATFQLGWSFVSGPESSSMFVVFTLQGHYDWGLAVWHPWLCRGPSGVSGHAGYKSLEVYSVPLPTDKGRLWLWAATLTVAKRSCKASSHYVGLNRIIVVTHKGDAKAVRRSFW